MKSLYLDIFSGISGDMFMGAMLDLGVPMEDLTRELEKLRLEGYHLHESRERRFQIEGVRFEVHVGHHHGDAHEHHHELDDHHEHEHEHPHEPEHGDHHEHSHDHHHEDGHKHRDSVVVGASLLERLLEQMRSSDMTDEQKSIAEMIIGNIDDHGYLKASVVELAFSTNI